MRHVYPVAGAITEPSPVNFAKGTKGDPSSGLYSRLASFKYNGLNAELAPVSKPYQRD